MKKPTEKPILFNDEMVRAILDGRKTQTRRVIKPQPVQIHDLNTRRNQAKGDVFIAPDLLPTSEIRKHVFAIALSQGSTRCVGLKEFAEDYCQFGTIGDRLWVRETFLTRGNGKIAIHKATIDPIEAAGISGMYGGWKPSIHMPRWASRITLEITNVRVERLQDISEEDAKAEGMEASKSVEMKDGSPCYTLPFQALWNRVYGCDAWEKNPYVWAITFKKL